MVGSKQHITRIQYVRAVAVISVLLYHYKIGFSRGFFGVDVFFVVSGFVITRSIFLKNSEFGLKQCINFYAARILRLFPAFATMNIFVMAGAILFLSPNIGVQQQVIKSGFGSILGISNIVIPKFTGGYFETPSQLNPYLHTWSLSVEEQFYLIFPLIMYIYFFKQINRSLKRAKALGIFVICFISFYYCFNSEQFQFFNEIVPVYFSPLARLWQFMLGFFIAKIVLSKSSYLQKFRVVFWPILVILIGLMNNSTINSEVAILSVTLLTSVLLISASQEKQNSFFNKPKSVLDYFGSRSYSIYLWHWPVIVFLPSAVIGITKSELNIIAIILTISISEFSYRFIEVKTQRKFRGLNYRILLVSALSLAVVLLFMLSAALFEKKGLGQSWALTSHSAIKKNCDLGLFQLPVTVGKACQWDAEVRTGPKKTIYIFGDSLAWSGADSIIDAGSSSGFGVRLFTRNGCYARLSDENRTEICDLWSRNVFKEIETNKPSVLFLFGNFTSSELPDDTKRLLENLRQMNQKTVLMLPPPWGDSYSEMKSLVNFGIENNRNGLRPPEISVPSEYKTGSFRTFDSSDLICSGSVCPISINGNELYNYGNHLSVYGNKFLTESLVSLLNDFK